MTDRDRRSDLCITTSRRQPCFNRSSDRSEAAGEIGESSVRNRDTLGGSLAHADPSAD
jgi:CO/xanthine dehydrogenase FAD-binding subunit